MISLLKSLWKYLNSGPSEAEIEINSCPFRGWYKSISPLNGKEYATPFYLGQKVVCITSSPGNYKFRGRLYEIRSFSRSTNDGWFLSFVGTPVSDWWENYVPYEMWRDYFSSEEELDKNWLQEGRIHQ
jgi:hypothetical protein